MFYDFFSRLAAILKQLITKCSESAAILSLKVTEIGTLWSKSFTVLKLESLAQTMSNKIFIWNEVRQIPPKISRIFLTDFRKNVKILLWNLLIINTFLQANIFDKKQKVYFINSPFLVLSRTKWPSIHYALLSTALR